MARKPTTKAKETIEDPLEHLETFDPESIPDGAASVTTTSGGLASPLGPPEPLGGPGASPIELLLQQANRRIERLRGELTTEREQRRELEKQNYQLEATASQSEKVTAELEEERRIRLDLERKIAAMASEVKHIQVQAAMYEEERAARVEMERKIGSLEFRADNMAELAEELDEHRKARVALERDKATLEIEVRHAAKLEALLTEERQARANAQMRASSAEAKLAQLEGELAARSQKGRGSIFGRSRG